MSAISVGIQGEVGVAASEGLTLPYACLNLRHNPFFILSPEVKSELDAIRTNLDHYARWLGEPGFAVQFLREGRSGKTTHLLALRLRFPGAPYICVRAQEPTPAIPGAPVLFIDQMQRMPRTRRMQILRWRVSYAIVSHVNHEREFKRAGLAYELIQLHGLDVERLHESIEKRILWARRTKDQPVPTVSMEVCARLLSRFGDDPVAIHACLYELFQEMTEVSDVQGIDVDRVRQA